MTKTIMILVCGAFSSSLALAGGLEHAQEQLEWAKQYDYGDRDEAWHIP